MQRINIPTRPTWQKRCEEAGFTYHTSEDGVPYWRESAAYRLSSTEIDDIEEATNVLHAMCLDHAADIVKRGDYQKYAFPAAVCELVERSWNLHERSLYGRFDLAYNGTEIKLLEYNADTPTSLLEAAVCQWHAKEDRGWPDQFNSLHERLIVRWSEIFGSFRPPILTFTAMESAGWEDWGNLGYLFSTAAEAGFNCVTTHLEKIAWSDEAASFFDSQGRAITACFKLYPWEWMLAEQFGWNIQKASTRWIEPAWKLLLSTKALLPQLWARHPNNPFLLPAYFEADMGTGTPGGKWARKPVLSREGANIALVENGIRRPLAGSTENPVYDESGYVLQQWFDIPGFDGFHPVLGSWVIGDEASGMGIREDRGVTGNASCFVPHYFE